MSVGVREKENIITNFVNPYNTARLLFSLQVICNF